MNAEQASGHSVQQDDNQSRGISRLGMGLGVLVTIGFAVITWFGPSAVVRLDNIALDFQFKLRGERDPGQDVVMVLVDEKSLKEVGRWPWSRDLHAKLVERIRSGGAKVIGLDIIYAEPEESQLVQDLQNWLDDVSRQRLISATAAKTLAARLRRAETDRQFAEQLEKAGAVVLAVPFFVAETQGRSRNLAPGQHVAEVLKRSEFMLVKGASGNQEMHPYEADSILPPLVQFATAARSLGHVYRLPDHDGITRREVLALRHQDSYYPSFALELARLYLGVPREQMALSLGEGVLMGGMVIQADPKFRMLINYAGRDSRFPWVSATDVLHGRAPTGFFTGKVVLVGTAALGTYDQLSTPFSANFSGVEKNATVIENIIHEQFLRTGLWAGPLEVGLVLLLGLVLAIILPRVRALYGLVLVMCVGTVYVSLVQYLFAIERLSLPLLLPMSTLGLVFMVITVLSYMLRERQAKEVRAMFASYVSPRIVRELMKSPAKARLGGERKELTMLFADLVGFTSYCEQRPAEAVVEQLNEYLTAMTEVIFRWNGTLDKFVGDEIVVFWGAPVDQPDHVELAVQCGLEMRARLALLQAKWEKGGEPILENGIGINTGSVVVGNIGAQGKKMDYTMIGDQVNLAARIQGLTRTLGHSILLTEYTAARLEHILAGAMRGQQSDGLTHVFLRKIRVVTVKGREVPVGVYTVERASVETGAQRMIEAPAG